MTVPVNQNMQIKGIQEGIMVSLGEGAWDVLLADLLQKISEQSSFFQGARLALDVGNRILHAAEMGTLRDQLSERGVSLWAVLSSSPITEQTAQVLGLATRLHTHKPERPIPAMDTNLAGESGVLIQRTMRSGHKLTAKGHVTVIGDVNPGAEIIATGNVIVWGKLKGVVHAGSGGDKEALVCALELTPTQLRIAGNIAVPPQRKGKSQPELARIVNGQIVAEPWDRKGK